MTAEKQTTKDKIKDILLNVIYGEYSEETDNDFFDTFINAEELDSLKIVEFMLQIEETFGVYIDEESMAELDFMGTYNDLIDGIAELVLKQEAENV